VQGQNISSPTTTAQVHTTHAAAGAAGSERSQQKGIAISSLCWCRHIGTDTLDHDKS